jgi:hypothetical protein
MHGGNEEMISKWWSENMGESNLRDLVHVKIILEWIARRWDRPTED